MRASLKTKLTVVLGGFVMVLIGTIVSVSLVYFEHQSKQVIAIQQSAMLGALASELDHKLATVHDALIAVSKTVPLKVIQDANEAQRFLDGQRALHTLLDNHLFLFHLNGKLIAESPVPP